jgi:hypothetical protein
MGNYLSQFTFYDIVGYLLPGALGVCAMAMLLSLLHPAWAILEPTSSGGWVVLMVAAYFMGHALQGVGYRLIPREKLRNGIAQQSTVDVERVVAKALERHSIDVTGKADRFAALDALKLDFPDRDVFVARQGFFRGAALAFALLAIALGAGAILARGVALFGTIIGRPLAAIAAAVAVALCVLFRTRYRDFLRHELEFAAAAGAAEQQTAGHAR